MGRTFSDALEQAGALPLLLPNLADPALAEAYLPRLDALLFTGGDDPHPGVFGEAPHGKIDIVDRRRDRFEIALCRAAHAGGWPVFGVCRGVQLMNIALGGDIWQDVASQTPSEISHNQKTMDECPWHPVDVRAGTLLERLVGASRIEVNSYHHQACRRMGDGLVASGVCPADGTVEAVEDPSRDFFLGVQWHPESLGMADPVSKGLFSGFVEAARKWAAAASNRKGAFQGR